VPAGRPGGDGAGADAAALSELTDHPAVRGRVAFLDVLRGIAMLGILPVNAGFFAYAVAVGLTGDYPRDGASLLPAALVTFLFERKFITTFSLLFGVGMGVQWLRARAVARPYGPPIARRLVVLAVFGALHATLLWYGDIVFVYGLLGLALCWTAGWRPAVLAWIGGLATLLPLALYSLLLLVAVVEPSAMAQAFAAEPPDGVGGDAATAPWRVFLSEVWEVDSDLETAVYSEGSFARIFVLRLVTWMWALASAVLLYVPRLGGLFLLGMAAARSSWALAPGSDRGRRIYTRLAVAGVVVGLPIEGVATLWTLGAEDAPALRILGEMVHEVGSLILSVGYASVVALLVARAPHALWTRPLTAVGRTAFSCYIGQSLVMTTLFYSYGLALFDRLSRWEVLGVVALVWIGQMVVATLWLRWFRIGPIEWVWRSLTHLQPQPFLREQR
jgi:uncharacterized protein